jgi:hypothetical protein
MDSPYISFDISHLVFILLAVGEALLGFVLCFWFETNIATTTYMLIWGKYLYTTSAATKATVSPITTNLKHLMMAIFA